MGDVMVSMLSSNVVNCGFNLRLATTKNYKIVNCCFSAMHAAFRSKSKDLLAWDQENMS